MLLKAKEKKERALGTKLFLKGDRCNSPKCAMIRRPYKPGMHGKKRRSVSDFGLQLREKQKIQLTFGLNNRQLGKMFKELAVKGTMSGQDILNLLERRLDNAVFRLGFANSRIKARQLVSHGHFLVNGRKVTIPSYKVRVSDKITIRRMPLSKVFEDLPIKLKKYEPPTWLKVDADKIIGEVVALPQESESHLNPSLVLEYFSR